MNWVPEDRGNQNAFVNEVLNIQITQAIKLVNIPISSQVCYVTMETIWKNTEGFAYGKTILRWVLNNQDCLICLVVSVFD